MGDGTDCQGLELGWTWRLSMRWTVHDFGVEAALRRATVRAVNDLVNRIPAKYFTHK